MPHPTNEGGSRVAALFRMRQAQRLGETDAADPDLSAYGETLGVGPLGGAAREAMPGRPMTEPSGAAMPAKTGAMRPQGEVATVSAARGRLGIPALDALSEMPRKRHRGLVHDRKLGRVMKAGG